MKELKHLIYFESLLEDTNNELVRKAESELSLIHISEPTRRS